MDNALPLLGAAALGWLAGRSWRPARAAARTTARATGWGVAATGRFAHHVAAPPARALAGAATAAGGAVADVLRQPQHGMADGGRSGAAADATAPADTADGGRSAAAPSGGGSGTDDLVAVSGGTKFHEPGCRMLGDAAALVKRDEARAEGRTPCRVCKP